MTGIVEGEVTRDRITDTHRVVREHIRRTPIVDVNLAGAHGRTVRVALKCEYMQVAGALKTRGAFANLLLRDTPPAGVVAASGGNHGVAVAYAAHQLGVPAAIFVPTISTPEKIARIRALGADLVFSPAPTSPLGSTADGTGPTR